MKAFPLYQREDCFPQQGMNLRDYFAAKAMVALTQKRYPHEILEEEYTKDIYKAAYKMADEMMNAREQ